MEMLIIHQPALFKPNIFWWKMNDCHELTDSPRKTPAALISHKNLHQTNRHFLKKFSKPTLKTRCRALYWFYPPAQEISEERNSRTRTNRFWDKFARTGHVLRALKCRFRCRKGQYCSRTAVVLGEGHEGAPANRSSRCASAEE